MKSFLVVLGLGALAIFAVVMFCVGMEAVFGDNAGKAMVAIIALGACSTVLGCMILSLFEDTRWAKALRRWAES